MAKVNAAAVELPSVTANGAPAIVGIKVFGFGAQIPGAPAVHDRLTVPPYPSIDVKVPFQLTFWLTVVVAGAAVTEMEKSGTGTVTLKPKV
jgi:hypothetical protein